MNLTKAQTVLSIRSYFGSNSNYFPSFLFYQTCSSDLSNLSISMWDFIVFEILLWWDTLMRSLIQKYIIMIMAIKNIDSTKIIVICGAGDWLCICLPCGHEQESSMESLLTELYLASCVAPNRVFSDVTLIWNMWPRLATSPWQNPGFIYGSSIKWAAVEPLWKNINQPVDLLCFHWNNTKEAQH